MIKVTSVSKDHSATLLGMRIRRCMSDFLCLFLYGIVSTSIVETISFQFVGVEKISLQNTRIIRSIVIRVKQLMKTSTEC